MPTPQMKEKGVDIRQKFLLHYEIKSDVYSVLSIIEANCGERCEWIIEEHGYFETCTLLQYEYKIKL